MKQRTFIRDFSHDIDDSTRQTFPEGWSGEVADDVAAAADKAGATAAPAKSEKADKAGATAAPATDAPPA